MKRAIVLLSGGVDSTTALRIAVPEYETYALTVLYGQRAAAQERSAAKMVAAKYGAAHHSVVSVQLAHISASPITGAGHVPKDGKPLAGRSPTYVPARNTVFLAMALAWSETLGADSIVIGANRADRRGYPDCRSEFFDAFETMAARATGGHRISVRAPLIEYTKSEVVRVGMALGIDYRDTFSCYDPDHGRHCTRCDACRLRADALAMRVHIGT